jgi:SAM-dependent methyltransferase
MTLPQFFYTIFESLPRQGPGCTGATRKAFSLLPPLKKDANVLDIGCGSGTQTRDLSSLTGGTITAVDNHQPFLDAVDAWVRKAGLGKRVRTLCASMDALPFEPGSFDLVWSEGAIFIVGFEKGLAVWKPLVKKGGFIVVSDAVRFEKEIPEPIAKAWVGWGYPLLTEEERADQVRRTGLRLVATYRLPEAGWLEHYFAPMQAKVDELKKTHGGDPAQKAVLDFCQEEIAMYRKYKQYYGYTFFIMQNI